MADRGHLAGLVLAGGRSSRMGGQDKAGLMLGGQTLLSRVVDRLRPQVGPLGINALPAQALPEGVANVPDTIGGQPGPLAGIAAGLAWASALGGVEHVVVCACDTPFFPRDLVQRLKGAARPGRVAMAHTRTGLHPTFSLWPVSLAGSIERHLAHGGSRRVTDLASLHGIDAVDFPDLPFDPFFNINTPQDLAEAARMIEVGQA